MTQKITVFLGIAVMAAVLFGGLSISQAAFAGVDSDNNGHPKETICHEDQITGDEKTITVGPKAAAAHLANHEGDYDGECSDEPEPSTCQECGDAFITDIDACGTSFECLQSTVADFADCTLTCTGDWDSTELGHQTDLCLNGEAAGLASCTALATDQLGLAACLDTWLVVDVCSNPP